MDAKRGRDWKRFDTRNADVEARLGVQAGVVADLDRRIAQIDGAIEKATEKGRTGSAMALAEQQRKGRADLVAQRTNEAKALAVLKVEKATADGERATVEADFGPVRYLATLLGGNDRDVLRWFILVIALLLDPAAVLLREGFVDASAQGHHRPTLRPADRTTSRWNRDGGGDLIFRPPSRIASGPRRRWSANEGLTPAIGGSNGQGYRRRYSRNEKRWDCVAAVPALAVGFNVEVRRIPPSPR